MKTLLLIAGLLVSSSSFAASTDVWEGPGALFDVKGNPTGTYQLVVENNKTDSLTLTNIVITLPDGSTQKEQCTMTETSDRGWVSKCGFGSGGGSCFGDGMCIDYEADSSGHAFATTLVMDGANDMRLLRTELQDGKAVRFYREKLHKKAN
jgi:hypothetical protein